MARKLLKDTCPTAADILDGKHDADLDNIDAAVKARKKMMFRKGAQVVIDHPGSANHGKTATVLRVNARTIQIGVGEKRIESWDEKGEFPYYSNGEFNVSANLLKAVA